MKRRSALVAAIVTLVIVVLLAPSAIASITGRPFFVDCGGLRTEVCDEAWRQRATGDGLGIGPITWVVVEPIRGTCGVYTFGHWWPFFDPLAMQAIPLC